MHSHLYARSLNFCCVAVLFTAIFSAFLAVASVRGAKLLHNRMLSNVLRCPMAFFDTTPIGRILNR